VGPAPAFRSEGARHSRGAHCYVQGHSDEACREKSAQNKSSTPAASRAKKKSWDMEDMEATPPWCDETFFDEMAEWWDSPEGSLWLDMLCELEKVVLKDVGLDARQRKFL